MEKNLKSRLMAPLVEPYARYLHANILHAMRLGIAVVASLLFSRWSQIPHSEWSTITVFVILGLLQYQGAIYTKAKERMLGTILGIIVGLLLLWLSHGLLGFAATSWIYYLLVGVISAIIGYYSIKQLGYIGLLTGITMCMVITSNDSVGPDGVARALNVLIGTLTAVLATLILPLKSTLMWRFLLANNLEACADMYDEVEAYIADPSLDERFAHTDESQGALDANSDEPSADKLSDNSGLAVIGNPLLVSDKPNSHWSNSHWPSSSHSGNGLNTSDADNRKDTGTDNQPTDADNDSNNEYNKHYPAGTTINNIELPHIHLDLGATTAASTMERSTHTAATTYVNTDMVAQFKEINKRLLRVRGHIEATARESKIDTQTLDMIQRTHRNIIGTIDLLLSAAPKLAQSPIDTENRILVDHYHRELTQAMRHMAAVLRSPSDEMFRPITRILVSDYPSIHALSFEWQGYFWLTQTLQGQLQSLSDLLQQTKAQWYAGSGLRYQRQEQRRIHAHGGESDLDV
ncbi:FUSC family protein [Psychrobacter sp. FDAARGOS_221]|uniref:FUSC family protein n=1 Tax=Psychrobacter sp. FDAARGOS_221 TaxID=1975705 RepID=UPI001D0D05DB|nr:FUSC family protein [Psychrobacter sp. FDAARGOS_221]